MKYCPIPSFVGLADLYPEINWQRGCLAGGAGSWLIGIFGSPAAQLFRRVEKCLRRRRKGDIGKENDRGGGVIWGIGRKIISPPEKALDR